MYPNFMLSNFHASDNMSKIALTPIGCLKPQRPYISKTVLCEIQELCYKGYKYICITYIEASHY